MGSIDEFSFSVKQFLRLYPWRRINPVPWAPLRKPLAECRMALVSSAGLVEPGQEPFDRKIRGGDSSFREIQDSTDVSRLIESHRSEAFDHSAVERDPNIALPLDRLRELVRDGRIGSANRRHISFMGSITATAHLQRRSAPRAAGLLVEDGVDAVLLVPV